MQVSLTIYGGSFIEKFGIHEYQNSKFKPKLGLNLWFFLCYLRFFPFSKPRMVETAKKQGMTVVVL